MKTKFLIVLFLSLGLTKINAKSINFECRDGQPNTAQDSIVYNYSASTGYFAPDFTIHQVNTNPNSTKIQYYKENKRGWRLGNGQALHFYAKDNVTAITQIDILCFDSSYVDTNIKTSAGTIEFVGDRIIRIVIPHEDNITEVRIFKDVASPQLRPVEITIDYLVDGEVFENPTPLSADFEPIAETYYRPWDVILSTQEPDATIYYTTDGTTPTTSSTVYVSPVYIDSDTEIKAITFKNGVASEVESSQYTIKVLPDVLQANTNYLIDFPDLERTAQETPAIAQISMPENFNPSKEHPIFVWFGGGDGGYTNGTPKRIIENKDFITIGLPYRSWDSPLGGGWRTTWEYHESMLDSIEQLIPNIDSDRRIVGGFSSGGAMITQHINYSNLEFQNYFAAFLPSGSAPHSSVPDIVLESIKDKPMLITVGENDPRSPFVGQYYTLVMNDADATFNLLSGVGHALPPSADLFIREWIYDKVMVGSSLLSATEIDTAKSVYLAINAKSNMLEISNLNDYEGVEIYISNFLGQILQTEKIKSNNTSIPLSQNIKPNTFHNVSVLKAGKFIFNKKFVILPNK